MFIAVSNLLRSARSHVHLVVTADLSVITPLFDSLNVAASYVSMYTSTHTSSSEQLAGLEQDFQAGVFHETYDCQLKQEILHQIAAHFLPADNPQQSEM